MLLCCFPGPHWGPARPGKATTSPSPVRPPFPRMPLRDPRASLRPRHEPAAAVGDLLARDDLIQATGSVDKILGGGRYQITRWTSLAC
mgnify:CR=1 FL=1